MCITSWIIAIFIVYVLVMAFLASIGAEKIGEVVLGPVGLLLGLALMALPITALMDVYSNWDDVKKIRGEHSVTISDTA